MSIEFKQFVIDFYHLPIDKTSIGLMKIHSDKEPSGMTHDPILIPSDCEDSEDEYRVENDTDRINLKHNQPVLVNNQDMRNNTRVIIISCNEYASLYQHDEPSALAIHSAQKNEVAKQPDDRPTFTKDKLFEIKDQKLASNKEQNASDNKISIKLGSKSRHLMRKVEELDDAVTSCEKLRGHPCTMTHCYNKATKRMNKIIT